MRHEVWEQICPCHHGLLCCWSSLLHHRGAFPCPFSSPWLIAHGEVSAQLRAFISCSGTFTKRERGHPPASSRQLLSQLLLLLFSASVKNLVPSSSQGCSHVSDKSLLCPRPVERQPAAPRNSKAIPWGLAFPFGRDRGKISRDVCLSSGKC